MKRLKLALPLISVILATTLYLAIADREIPSLFASHSTIGNEGQEWRLPWKDRLGSGPTHRSTMGPNRCTTLPDGSLSCHGPGSVDWDFSTIGEAVLAIGDGIVTRAGPVAGAGNIVELRHALPNNYPYTFRSRYIHLDTIKTRINVGATITQGQVTATSGSTGAAAPHLHFDICEYDIECDQSSSDPWPVQISHTTETMWIVPDGQPSWHPSQSNNTAPGYDSNFENGLDTDFKVKYQSLGGWGRFGSTSRMEYLWRINRDLDTRFRFSYITQFGSISAQTFRWTDGYWRQALVKNPRAPGFQVFHVYGGIYTIYTDYRYAVLWWLPWAYWLGGPTSDVIQDVNPQLLYQYFEQGWYIYYNPSTCQVWVYDGGGRLQDSGSGQAYCDAQTGPGLGYGSDGN